MSALSTQLKRKCSDAFSVSDNEDDVNFVATPNNGKICYLGRLAPSPSGQLHKGHAYTFLTAMQRARDHQLKYELQVAAGEEDGPLGPAQLLLRIEDLDVNRCKEKFVIDNMRDLQWLGITWDIGPGSVPAEEKVGKATMKAGVVETEHSPLSLHLPMTQYYQQNRGHIYVRGLALLRQYGFVYASPQSRKDITEYFRRLHDTEVIKDPDVEVSPLSAPNEGDTEVIFPIALRPSLAELEMEASSALNLNINWRFRVPDDAEPICFTDGRCGYVSFTPLKDFGDFVVFSKAGCAAYEMAVVIDDSLMGVTEVVRGEDLLVSAARQILIRRALHACVRQECAAGRDPGFSPTVFEKDPQYYHCQLIRGEDGRRLSKRNGSKSIGEYREAGWTPDMVIAEVFKTPSAPS